MKRRYYFDILIAKCDFTNPYNIISYVSMCIYFNIQYIMYDIVRHSYFKKINNINLILFLIIIIMFVSEYNTIYILIDWVPNLTEQNLI